MNNNKMTSIIDVDAELKKFEAELNKLDGSITPINLYKTVPKEEEEPEKIEEEKIEVKSKDEDDLKKQLKALETEYNLLLEDNKEYEATIEKQKRMIQMTNSQRTSKSPMNIVEDEALRKQLKALQVEYTSLLKERNDLSLSIQKALRMVEYVGKHTKRIGLSFDEMDLLPDNWFFDYLAASSTSRH